MKRILALLTLSVSAAFAQVPVVTEILNNYSLINPGTVAQGAIFIVKGSNLSDLTTGLQEVPLHTDLQGVSIAIDIDGKRTFAPIYYVLPQQLAGILPSSTSVGAGTLTVRNNGKNSAPVPINVVRSAFGVLTASGAGTGSARVQDASQGYQELSTTRATNPGNFLVFYGSGVGPVTGDETLPQVQTDLTGIPVTVNIGGKPAPVFYRGRTAFPGLDQINVQVPALDSGVYGCNVPVVITTNGFAANATTIPVAQSGSTCPTSSNTGGGPVSGATQQEIDRWIAAGSYTSGNISVGRNTVYSVADSLPGVNPGTTITRSDAFTAVFQRIAGSDLATYLRGGTGLALGSCRVTHSSDPVPALTYSPLDAGPAITSSGPGGVQVASRNGAGYSVLVPNTYVAAGRYTFTGVGGANVGAFSGNMDVLPDFVVNNADDLKTITRGAGLTVRWTGGDSTVPVQISGASPTINPDGTAGASTGFVCLAANLDGRFTVPSSVLTQLPATTTLGGAGFELLLRGSVSVTTAGKGTRITASGVDYFTANNSWTWTVASLYQ